MCGRFTLTYDGVEVMAEALDVHGGQIELPGDYRPRWNIAPTDWHYILRMKGEEQQLLRAKWGLVNSWAHDAKDAAKAINARAETIATRPAFRDAFAHRRCIVPADGFYEWRKTESGREPYWFHRPKGAPLLMAGLYESWQPKPGEWERTFTIVTTRANELVGQLHDRMPVVLDLDAASRWMFATTPRSELDALLVPAPADALEMTAVSQRVNSVKNDDPSLLLPPEATPRLL